MKKNSYQKCYNLALYYLAKRQHSVAELSKKLKDKEHSSEDLEKTVIKLKDQHQIKQYSHYYCILNHQFEKD